MEMPDLVTTWLIFLSIITVVISSDSPRLYDFVNKDEIDSADLRRYGNSSEVDYFRLLEVDGDHLIIGAADSVHNISIDKFERISLYGWKPNIKEVQDCAMKSLDDLNACRNYIRVLSRDERTGNLLICGTNSFKPLCRVVDQNNVTVMQFDGTGVAPHNPSYNTTFYREGDYIYSATVTDFSAADYLIFRRNISKQEDYGIRTEKNRLHLQEPQFVGALNSEKYVYFFFREIGIEASELATYSRVARVCKNDIGGPRNHKHKWTTFVKMRLNCSIPEKNKRFYFDEIISISNVTHNIKSNGRNIVYATFVSEFEFLRYSVICAFDLDQIDDLFASSDYYESELSPQRYVRKRRGGLKLGQCHPNSTQLNDEELISAIKYPLLADSAPNVFGRAVGIHRGSDNYNQIVVLEGVQIQDGEEVDVLYVGTDQGNVIKMVNLINKNLTRNSTNEIEFDFMHKIAQYKVSKLPIRRLLIAKNKYLIVVTDPVVYRLPLHFCGTYSTCDECIGARDPHCVWHQGECTSVKDVKQKFVYQDMLQKRSKICDEARAVDKPRIEKKLKSTTIKPQLRLKDEHQNITPDECDCNSKDLKARLKCNCLNKPEFSKLHNSTSNQSPIVSNEVEQSKRDGSNWSLWVLIGAIVLIIQTGALIILYCKYRSKRRKAKKASVTLQMPKTSVQSVINAYCPTLTDTYIDKSKNGTLKRGPMGEVNIHLSGNGTPTSMY